MALFNLLGCANGTCRVAASLKEAKLPDTARSPNRRRQMYNEHQGLQNQNEGPTEPNQS